MFLSEIMRRDRLALIHSLSITALMSVLALASACADDATAEPPKKAVPNQSDEPKNDSESKSLLDNLAKQLLGGSDDAAHSDSADERESSTAMQRAAKGMHDAGNRLDDGQTSEDTQKIQKQVIKDLEDLINQLENPPPNKGGGGGGGSGGGGGGGRGGGSGRGGRGGGGSALRSNRTQRSEGRGSASARRRQNQSQANANEENGGKSSENSTDSSKDVNHSGKGSEEAERRRKLEMDVWGHLPIHVREELLSTYGGRTLPKYEQMVKQFYEALSTQGDSKKK
jgi:hypothetical protein